MKTNLHQFSRASLLIFIAFIFLFTSCAPVTSVEACVDSEPFGFWSGLWHGFISPISFIVGLFKEDVAIYAINNTGSWYDFGFLLGAASFLGGSSKAKK